MQHISQPIQFSFKDETYSHWFSLCSWSSSLVFFGLLMSQLEISWPMASLSLCPEHAFKSYEARLESLHLLHLEGVYGRYILYDLKFIGREWIWNQERKSIRSVMDEWKKLTCSSWVWISLVAPRRTTLVVESHWAVMMLKRKSLIIGLYLNGPFYQAFLVYIDVLIILYESKIIFYIFLINNNFPMYTKNIYIYIYIFFFFFDKLSKMFWFYMEVNILITIS